MGSHLEVNGRGRSQALAWATFDTSPYPHDRRQSCRVRSPRGPTRALPSTRSPCVASPTSDHAAGARKSRERPSSGSSGSWQGSAGLPPVHPRGGCPPPLPLGVARRSVGAGFVAGGGEFAREAFSVSRAGSFERRSARSDVEKAESIEGSFYLPPRTLRGSCGAARGDRPAEPRLRYGLTGRGLHDQRRRSRRWNDGSRAGRAMRRPNATHRNRASRTVVPNGCRANLTFRPDASSTTVSAARQRRRLRPAALLAPPGPVDPRPRTTAGVALPPARLIAPPHHAADRAAVAAATHATGRATLGGLRARGGALSAVTRSK